MSQLAAAGIEPVAMYADISLVPENPGQTVLWLEKSRLAVRRPGALPFAVELTPVTEALVVAGVIPDPLDEPPREAKSPRPWKARCCTSPARTGRGYRTSFRGWPASSLRSRCSFSPMDRCRGSRAVCQPPMRSICCRASSPAPPTTAPAGSMAHRRDARGGLLVAHVAAAALQIHQANHETQRSTARSRKSSQQAMPAEKMQDPRRQMQSRLDRIRHSGAGPEYFLRASRS